MPSSETARSGGYLRGVLVEGVGRSRLPGAGQPATGASYAGSFTSPIRLLGEVPYARRSAALNESEVGMLVDDRWTGGAEAAEPEGDRRAVDRTPAVLDQPMVQLTNPAPDPPLLPRPNRPADETAAPHPGVQDGASSAVPGRVADRIVIGIPGVTERGMSDPPRVLERPGAGGVATQSDRASLEVRPGPGRQGFDPVGFALPPAQCSTEAVPETEAGTPTVARPGQAPEPAGAGQLPRPAPAEASLPSATVAPARSVPNPRSTNSALEASASLGRATLRVRR